MVDTHSRPRCVCCVWPILLSALQALAILARAIGAVDWPWAHVVAPIMLAFVFVLGVAAIDYTVAIWRWWRR